MDTKVLILDDNDDLQNLWRKEIALRHVTYGDTISIISASTIEDAVKQFRVNPDLAIIVVCGCIMGIQPSTIPFVKEIRKISNVPIIATAMDSWFQKELMKAGCSHESSKDYLPRKILEVLGLRNPPI